MIRRSKTGFIASGIFFLLAIAAMAWHLYSISTNTGDSGESGIVLLPFVLPWMVIIPDALIYSKFGNAAGPILYFACVSINAFILYLIAAGLASLTNIKKHE